jgi:hypothetical protein
MTQRTRLVPSRAKAGGRPFQIGHQKMGGRKKGTPNYTTKFAREAIIEGLSAIGEDGQGLNGLTGFVIRAARADIKYGVQMLGMVTPKQIDAVINHDPVEYKTIEDIERDLAARGLPPMREIFQIDWGSPVEEAERPRAEILPPGRQVAK